MRQLRANLARVAGPGRPSCDALVRQAMRSYARYWLETFRLPRIDPGRRSASAPSIDRRRHPGQGAGQRPRRGPGAAAHAATGTSPAVWLLDHGAPLTTVAERLKPESLYERFVAYRESLGMEVLPLTGGDRAARDVLERAAARPAGWSACSATGT